MAEWVWLSMTSHWQPKVTTAIIMVMNVLSVLCGGRYTQHPPHTAH